MKLHISISVFSCFIFISTTAFGSYRRFELSSTFFNHFCSSNFGFILCFTAQETNDREKTLVWCTVSIEEQYKCLNFSAAVQADTYLFRSDYHYHVSCKQVQIVDLFLIEKYPLLFHCFNRRCVSGFK